jgi:2-keto-4-pentenoate hydratase
MSREAIETASDLLIGCWQRGERIAALPRDIRPTSRAEGYAIQARLERLSAAPLFGWKIAATSVAGQAHIGVDSPLAGRLLAERVIAAGQPCPYGANQMQVAELEFAFRMGKDLPPRAEAYSVDEVLDAVATLHPAIEIPDSRFDPFETAGGPQLIADDACANYFKLGEAASDSWRQIDLAAHPAVGRINHGPEQLGIGGSVLGDPRIALTWIANELSALGITLASGQVVTTGTCVIPMKIAPGDHIFGDLGAIGTVSLMMATS